MYKNLLFILTLSLAISLPFSNPQTISASHKKRFSGEWLLVKSLLAENSPNAFQTPQVIAAEIGPSPTPTVTPTTTKSGATATTSTPPTNSPTASSSTPVLATSNNDINNYILNGINTYRSSLNLSSVHSSTETCNFANIRAQEIASNFSHDGFTQRMNNHNLPYAHWSAVTENIAMTTKYIEVETLWQNSPGHAENMRADTPYACVGHSGDYYAYEGMKP